MVEKAAVPPLVRNVCLITLLVCLAGGLSYLATISHGTSHAAAPAAMATAATLFGILPPLCFGRLLPNGAANQLAVVAWRLAIMLPALAIAWRFDGAQRNCFLMTLMACYFVGLPLESWLLIRDVRQPREPHP